MILLFLILNDGGDENHVNFDNQTQRSSDSKALLFLMLEKYFIKFFLLTLQVQY